MPDDAARIGFRLSGAHLAQVRDVQQIMGFNTPTDTIKYLAQRGLEGMAGQLAMLRLVRRMEGMADPEQMLPLIASLDAKGVLAIPGREKTL